MSVATEHAAVCAAVVVVWCRIRIKAELLDTCRTHVIGGEIIIDRYLFFNCVSYGISQLWSNGEMLQAACESVATKPMCGWGEA